MKTAAPIPRRRVDAFMHVQLVEDVAHMVLGRRQLDALVAGDLLIRLPLIDQAENLPLGLR